ncbi:MAG: hypothetical protein QOI53_1319, partial [Verrucomicrobiota bacterium]|nr:hypothetical protein [Verrucomicrobiota bacterium]
RGQIRELPPVIFFTVTMDLSPILPSDPELGSMYGPRACPAGATGLSPGFQPGFNPGIPHNKRFALKGREMRIPDEARTYCGANVRVRNWDVRQLNHRTPLPPC